MSFRYVATFMLIQASCCCSRQFIWVFLNDKQQTTTTKQQFIPANFYLKFLIKQAKVSFSKATVNSPVGVISTFSVEGLLVYFSNIGGLTVWGIGLSLSSSLHTGITAARPRTCVTLTSETDVRVHSQTQAYVTNHLACIQYNSFPLIVVSTGIVIIIRRPQPRDHPWGNVTASQG